MAKDNFGKNSSSKDYFGKGNFGEDLQKTNDDQANVIATLEEERKKTEDPNAGPRVIKKGNQAHPKYQRNNQKISATIPKEN